MSKKSLLEIIGIDPARDRGPVVRGLEANGPNVEKLPTVDKDGGSRKAGIIRGASLISEGEALGHAFWIDSESLDSVVALGNESANGVKVRFTHPAMSGDGLGSYLGRAKELRRDGSQVLADVHFSPSSRTTPDGDRGGYVMDLATDDPESFGMSIVFDHDFGAEKEHEGKYSDTDGVFNSPDEMNAENMAHVRFASLHGADFVDEPAANPDGLFHTGPTSEIIKQADATLSYVLGATSTPPSADETGGLSAERLRGFLRRYLENRGLGLEITGIQEGLNMTEQVLEEIETTVDEAPVDPEAIEAIEAIEDEAPTEPETEPEEVPITRHEFRRFVEKFGAERGAIYLADGVTFENALSMELDELKKRLANREERGEEKPVEEFATGLEDSLSERQKIVNRKRGFNLPIRISGNGQKG